LLDDDSDACADDTAEALTMLLDAAGVETDADFADTAEALTAGCTETDDAFAILEAAKVLDILADARGSETETGLMLEAVDCTDEPGAERVTVGAAADKSDAWVCTVAILLDVQAPKSVQSPAAPPG